MIKEIIDPDVKTFLLNRFYTVVCVKHEPILGYHRVPRNMFRGITTDWADVTYYVYELPELQKIALKFVLKSGSFNAELSSSITLLFNRAMTFKARRAILLNQALFAVPLWLNGNMYKDKPINIGECYDVDANLFELDHSALAQILTRYLSEEILRYAYYRELVTAVVDVLDRKLSHAVWGSPDTAQYIIGNDKADLIGI